MRPIDTNIPLVYRVPCMYAVVARDTLLRVLHFFSMSCFTEEARIFSEIFDTPFTSTAGLNRLDMSR